MIKTTTENSWFPWLKYEFSQPYFMKMKKILNQEYLEQTCFPPRNLIFRAFETTPKEKIKVVILGQDPYHNFNQADGLAFSVQKQNPPPMSLKNIFCEIKNNYPSANLPTGDLTYWAQQGVFLLNTILTVRLSKPLSHKAIGWEIFTDRVLKEINLLSQPIAIVLWGQKAQIKSKILTNKKHQIFISSHPSPFSVHYGFFGSQVFSKVNAFLISQNLKPIDWETK